MKQREADVGKQMWHERLGPRGLRLEMLPLIVSEDSFDDKRL